MPNPTLHESAYVIDGLVVSRWSREVFEAMHRGGLTAANCTCCIWEGLRDTMINIARWKQANETKALNMLVSDFVKGKARLRYIETYDSTLGPDGQIRPELFLKDGLHFNTEGYKVLAALVRADLPESAPSNAAPSKKRSDSE